MLRLPQFERRDWAVIWFIRDFCDNWSTAEKCAYGALYSRMNEAFIAFPSQDLLARDMGAKDKRTATTAVKGLEQKRALEQIKRRDPTTGAQLVTQYKLHPPWQADNTWDRSTWPYPQERADRGEGANFAPGEGAKNPLGAVHSMQEPGAKNAPEAKQKQSPKEETEKKEQHGAAATVPPDLLEGLQKHVSDTLTEKQIAQAIKQYGELRVKFAGARVAQKKAQCEADGVDSIPRPVGFFFGILRSSTNAEAQEFFERLEREQAGFYRVPKPKRGFAALMDLLREAEARENPATYYGPRPPSTDDLDEEVIDVTPEEPQDDDRRRWREMEQQMLGNLAEQRRTAEAEPPAPPQEEKTPEQVEAERIQEEERQQEEARAREIRNRRSIATNKRMAQTLGKLGGYEGSHMVELYEDLMAFFDSPEYRALGDTPDDPNRAEYEGRLAAARAQVAARSQPHRPLDIADME